MSLRGVINVAKSAGGLGGSLLADGNLLGEDAEMLKGNVLWDHYWWSNHLLTTSWKMFRLNPTKSSYWVYEIVSQ